MKLPGPGGATVTLPLADPLRTGKLPPPDTGAVTVSLFPALGCFPPLLKHCYTAEASAVTVMCSLVTFVPSPASLNVTTRLPLPSVEALALVKCGLSANAGTAASASAISDSTAMMPIFLIKVFLPCSVGPYRSLST